MGWWKLHCDFQIVGPFLVVLFVEASPSVDLSAATEPVVECGLAFVPVVAAEAVVVAVASFGLEFGFVLADLGMPEETICLAYTMAPLAGRFETRVMHLTGLFKQPVQYHKFLLVTESLKDTLDYIICVCSLHILEHSIDMGQNM